MAQNPSAEEPFAPSWSEFLRDYQRLMDEVMPYLPTAEQVLYHRLFRLSHGRRSPYVQCRYEELAKLCGLSLRTLQRALKGLKQKQVVKTVWHSHGATLFTSVCRGSWRANPPFYSGTRGCCSPPLPASL